MHPATLAEEQLLDECDFTATRRSGPGGQHRNKVETAVVLQHRPSGIVAEASEERSQAANRRVAIHRLRVRLAVEVRQPSAEGPSPLWRSRRQGTRLPVNSQHADFPALLAEALDQLAAHDFELPAAAARLEVSATQLANLVRLAPAAWVLLNQERQSRGLGPLK